MKTNNLLYQLITLIFLFQINDIILRPTEQIV